MTRVLAVVLLLACAGTPAQAPLGPGTIRWWTMEPRQPTTMHLYIYEQMQDCLGIVGQDFASIQWFTSKFIINAEYRELAGFWVGTQRLIVLQRETFNDPVTVSEELLHSLLVGTNVDHDDPEFQRCVVKRL